MSTADYEVAPHSRWMQREKKKKYLFVTPQYLTIKLVERCGAN